MQIPYTQFHPYLDKSVENTDRNFTPISEIWLSAPIFTKIAATLMYMDIFSTEFYPNMTKDV
jgi:hypothetical protein